MQTEYIAATILTHKVNGKGKEANPTRIYIRHSLAVGRGFPRLFWSPFYEMTGVHKAIESGRRWNKLKSQRCSFGGQSSLALSATRRMLMVFVIIAVSITEDNVCYVGERRT
jgi:hypothetical protein